MKKVGKKIQKANFTSMEHAAATLRKIAVNSIRQGKTKDNIKQHAKKGKPPKTWWFTKYRFKKDIQYSVKTNYLTGRAEGIVYARPEKMGDMVYQMHEKGGSQTVTKTILESTYRNRRSRDGSNYTYKPLSERSEKERTAIRNYYKNMRRRSRKRKISFRATYPARPFLEPALNKIKPRLPKIWKTEINKELRNP
ncbi:MAG: hypothetical protein LBC74_11625 [Planctomycetaceae bacterium]|nr:hypothetical protein [Planctomycetaceae bacterium]